MTPNLTDDQRHAVEENSEEEEYNPREAYPFVERVMQEDDAYDPTLEHYQDL